MNRQDGRYTVAYESKASPHFTINIKPLSIMEGNRGGTLAFFERLEWYHENSDMLLSLGVFVDSDCGVRTHDPVIFELVHSSMTTWLCERNRSPEGVEHEAL